MTGYRIEKINPVIGRGGAMTTAGGWYVLRPSEKWRATLDDDGNPTGGHYRENEIVSGPHATKADAARAVGWNPEKLS
jgi:hypothetical protein